MSIHTAVSVSLLTLPKTSSPMLNAGRSRSWLARRDGGPGAACARRPRGAGLALVVLAALGGASSPSRVLVALGVRFLALGVLVALGVLFLALVALLSPLVGLLALVPVVLFALVGLALVGLGICGLSGAWGARPRLPLRPSSAAAAAAASSSAARPRPARRRRPRRGLADLAAGPPGPAGLCAVWLGPMRLCAVRLCAVRLHRPACRAACRPACRPGDRARAGRPSVGGCRCRPGAGAGRRLPMFVDRASLSSCASVRRWRHDFAANRQAADRGRPPLPGSACAAGSAGAAGSGGRWQARPRPRPRPRSATAGAVPRAGAGSAPCCGLDMGKLGSGRIGAHICGSRRAPGLSG